MRKLKSLKSIPTELFMRERNLNISVVLVSQSYLKVPKTVKLNATHYLMMKKPNKREPQQIALNNSSDIEFKDFEEPFSFLKNDATLPSDNPSRFRKNLL